MRRQCLLPWCTLRTTAHAGISLKSLELYALVFLTRYLDLFTNHTSLYNTVYKVFYLSASFGLVYLLRYREPYRSTYLFERDTFLHWKFAVAPCAVLALVFSGINWFDTGVLEILREVRAPQRTTPSTQCTPRTRCTRHPRPLQYFWTFSLFLESIAIFPQLVMLTRDRDVENITMHYVAALGSYRALYILNWIYRAWTEPHYWALLPWVTGAIQTALYSDFFYRYYISVSQGTPLKL